PVLSSLGLKAVLAFATRSKASRVMVKQAGNRLINPPQLSQTRQGGFSWSQWRERANYRRLAENLHKSSRGVEIKTLGFGPTRHNWSQAQNLDVTESSS